MNRRGSALLIIALAVIILLMVGAALFMTGGRSAAPGSSSAATGIKFTVSYARASGGVNATLTVANSGSSELSDLQLIRADIASMTGGKPMPIKIGKLPAGGATIVTLLYTGPAPAAHAPLQISLQYDYKIGFFGRGAGSSSLTAFVP